MARDDLARAPGLAALDRLMASPTYGIDAVSLAFAVILAAAIAFLISQIMPPLADLVMLPPLIGSANPPSSAPGPASGSAT